MLEYDCNHSNMKKRLSQNISSIFFPKKYVGKRQLQHVLLSKCMLVGCQHCNYCCISKTLSSTRVWHSLFGLSDASESRQTVALPLPSKTTAPFMVIVAVSPGLCANPLMLHDTALVWLIQTASSTESCCLIENRELSFPFWIHYFLITSSHLFPIPV